MVDEASTGGEFGQWGGMGTSNCSSAAVERLFSASASVSTAKRCRRMQKETLEIHSEALKHDVNIPDKFRSWSRRWCV